MKTWSLDHGLPRDMNGFLFCDLQWAKLQAKQVYEAPEAGEAKPRPLEGVLERGEGEEEAPCQDDRHLEAYKTWLIKTALWNWQLKWRRKHSIQDDER